MCAQEPRTLTPSLDQRPPPSPLSTASLPRTTLHGPRGHPSQHAGRVEWAASCSGMLRLTLLDACTLMMLRRDSPGRDNVRIVSTRSSSFGLGRNTAWTATPRERRLLSKREPPTNVVGGSIVGASRLLVGAGRSPPLNVSYSIPLALCVYAHRYRRLAESATSPTPGSTRPPCHLCDISVPSLPDCHRRLHLVLLNMQRLHAVVTTHPPCSSAVVTDP